MGIKNTIKSSIMMALICCHYASFAQVTGVNFLMEYDDDTGLYNCCIVIDSGSAMTVQERVQFNSQMTVVTPVDVTISVDTFYMPLEDNANYTGTIPTTWWHAFSEIGPPITPDLSYHAIIPNLSPASFFNDLNPGDTICLYGVSVSEDLDCGQSIRFFDNVTDPTSAEFPGGEDFSNGYAIGGPTQLYVDNLDDIEPEVTAELIGPDTICVSETTQLLPDSNGTWVSDNPGVATIFNDGLVTGFNPGVAGMVFTESSTGCMTEQIDITVLQKPALELVGYDTICVGGNTTLLPMSGGTWTSSNPIVATINNDGLVTGYAEGSAVMCFTNSETGCVTCFDELPIVVSSDLNTELAGPSQICVGEEVILSPTQGGQWVTDDPVIATITSTGIITGYNPGTVSCYWTDLESGCQNGPLEITVVENQFTAGVDQTLDCVIFPGGSTFMTACGMGIWSAGSGNAGLATITTASSPYTQIQDFTIAGEYSFYWTDGNNVDTVTITVIEGVEASLLGPDTICYLGTTQVFPNTGVTWGSTDPSIATVSNSGLVTGILGGTTDLVATSSLTGCQSNPISITVLPMDTLELTGPDAICSGDVSFLSPTSGGTWSSADPSIATITNGGVITGIFPGATSFCFTNAGTGCTTCTENYILSVYDDVQAEITGPETICITSETTLSPTSGGTWTSSDPSVATVTHDGIVTGVAEGSASFCFTNSTTGCFSCTSSINVENFEFNAGPDQNLYCFDFNVQDVTMNATGSGSWSADPGNPGITVIQGDLFPDATISAINIPGAYTFYWSNGLCTDEVVINVFEQTDPGLDQLFQCASLPGGTVTMNAGGTGLWVSSGSNPASATIVNPEDPNTEIINFTAAGTYTFIWTMGEFCGSGVDVIVTEQPDAGPDQTVDCAVLPGGVAYPSATPSFAGVWTASGSNPGVVTITDVTNPTTTFTDFSSPGEYHFYWTNGSCIDMMTVTVTEQADAGPDPAPLLCYQDDIAFLNASGIGTWSVGNNTGTLIIDDPNNPQTTVRNFSVPGIYELIWTVGDCFDVVNIEVLNECECGITNNFIPPPADLTFCEMSPVVDLIGEDATPAGGIYEWLYSNNGSAFAPVLGIFNQRDYSTAPLGIGVHEFRRVFTTFDPMCSDTSNTITIVVLEETGISLTGPSEICVGQTSQMVPTSGGTWVSNNVSVATIDNAGVITGVGPGTVSFCFTDSATSCLTCTDVGILTVNGSDPAEITGPQNICIGGSTTLAPITGVTWVSNNTSVATISNSGLVTAVSQGATTFCYTDLITGCMDCTDPVIVDPNPTVSSSETEICIGFTANLSPSSGGEWTALSPGIATLTDDNIVTGIAHGVAEFVFTESITGCDSHVLSVIVKQDPEVMLTGPSEICVGQTTSVSSESNGTWASADDAIATITNNGVITGVSPGVVTFCFTDILTGCMACGTFQVTVYGQPDAGPDQLLACVDLPGGTVDLEAQGIGTWILGPGSPGSASITNPTDPNTTVTNFSDPGLYTLIWTGGICADEMSIMITQNVYAGSDQAINCVNFPGGSVTMSATHSPAGVWTAGAGNPDVAIITDDTNPTTTITNFGNPGTYTFVWTDGTCFDEVTITLTEQPDAGSDQIVDCESPDLSVTMNATGSGVWTASATNTGFATITDDTNPNSTITDFTEEGVYTFIWADGNCIDEVMVSYECYDPCEDEESIPTISGIAYIDQNGNGVQDVDELPLRNVLIFASPGNLSVITDEDGYYTIEVEEGTFDLTASINDGDWESFEITQENILVDQPCVEDVNFAFVPIPFTGISISVSNTIVRCDQSTIFYLTVENFGSSSSDARLVFDFDDRTEFEITNAFNYTLDGNSLEIITGPLTPFAPKTFIVALKMPPISFPIPQLQFTASTYTLFDGEFQHEYSFIEELRCSYDPNDKRVYPDRDTEANLTLFEEDLEYTIRFQNNGNDTAFQVKIIDPLDPNIDQRSVRVVSSSHPVETSIENDTLIFLFRDILLVDSTTNFIESQGFVTYKCNTLPGLDELSEVHNIAEIIFDSNPPLVTNEVVNTMLSEFCTDTTVEEDVSICFGDSYMGHTESGTYVESVESPFGCDSLMILNLDVQQIELDFYAETACEGDTIIYNDIEYWAQGIYQDTSFTNEGCMERIVELEFSFINLNFSDIDLCVGSTSIINPPLQGVWTSENPEIVTISENGGITADSEGVAEICFTDMQSACTACFLANVYNNPDVFIAGDNAICIGESTEAFPNSGGVWSSNDASIASITNDGMVTAHNAGICQLIFTSNETGCTSESMALIVLPGDDSECVVGTEELTDREVIIYPNPATDKFTIESTKQIDDIQIYDVAGIKTTSVINNFARGKTEVQTHNLASGLYILVLRIDGKRIYKKVVIE